MDNVHIELQRVQTWLFSVPRLRAMVGANAQLGEALRVALPKLAREQGRGWALAPFTEAYSGTDSKDPLKEHDDPAADARDGILARDGGHFEAQFAHGAEAFAEAAAGLLRSELPGLRFRVSINNVEQQSNNTHLSTELPVFAPCKWTGRGLASAIVKQGDERPAVSLNVARRHEAATRTEDGTAKDLASLLGATTKLNGLKRAQELEDLVGSGYLALIHADGNGVGSVQHSDDVARANFFHRNRVLLRRAAQRAIDVACEGEPNQAPLIPLMLGGDDLLLVCRAECALGFVVTLCEELAALQHEDESDFTLTLGVGVVIAKQTIPIHRLHEVAEQLASSSKRRFQGFKDAHEKRSVVDWAVYSTAWVEDLEQVRSRDWLRGSGQDIRVLSQRPLDVLGQSLDSLQGLVAGARQIETVPRSQLRYLIEQLAHGRALSDLAFAELSKETRDALGRAGVTGVWYRPSDKSPWMTALLDIVEISEIARLGRNATESQATKEAAHD